MEEIHSQPESQSSTLEVQRRRVGQQLVRLWFEKDNINEGTLDAELKRGNEIRTVDVPSHLYHLPICLHHTPGYFLGNLVFLRCEGYGTDAITILKVFLDEANKLLPIFNKATSKFYRTTILISDWSSRSVGVTAAR